MRPTNRRTICSLTSLQKISRTTLVNPLEAALKQITGHAWLVSVGCAERMVEVEEDGEMMLKTQIIEMPEADYDYIVQAGEGKPVAPIEFEVGEPNML